MVNNGANFFNRIIQTVLAAMLIAAIVGLIALRDTARANTARLNSVEPITKATAEDISTIKTDIEVIKTILEIEHKRRKMDTN